jgi:hypothetical protein
MVMNLIQVSPASNYKIDQTLTSNDVLLIQDVFDQSVIDQLLTDNNPRYIVNDHFARTSFDNVYSVPKFLSSILSYYSNIFHKDQIITDHTFYFMINKRRINRYLLLKLLEWFELSTKENYWMTPANDRFDLSALISEFSHMKKHNWFTDKLKSFLLEPVRINDRVDKNAPIFTDHGAINSHQIWEKFLDPEMSRSAVCLISESVEFQRASVFTEKTLYSVISVNFPIWIGGYGQAREWQRLGFDIFDDVIDHSYQCCDTLLERCYRAIQDNLKILTDLDHAREMRQKNLDRFQKNLDLLMSDHLERQIFAMMESWPDDLKNLLKKHWCL